MLKLALVDLKCSIASWRLWTLLGWLEVRQRYARSRVGPFWLTISMGVMILALGFLYARLFKQDIHSYLPMLCLGLLAWTFISSVMTDGCNCFLQAEGIILQTRMPFTVHVLRSLYRNLIVLGHNAAVYVLVAIYFQISLNAASLLVIPGLAIQLLNGFWISLLLGMICARFRDVLPIVASLIQIGFFMTPILWSPDSLGRRHWIADFNPLYAMVELTRAPLLGQLIPLQLWCLALATTAGGLLLTLLFFVRFRARIPYWI